MRVGEVNSLAYSINQQMSTTTLALRFVFFFFFFFSEMYTSINIARDASSVDALILSLVLVFVYLY